MHCMEYYKIFKINFSAKDIIWASLNKQQIQKSNHKNTSKHILVLENCLFCTVSFFVYFALPSFSLYSLPSSCLYSYASSRI